MTNYYTADLHINHKNIVEWRGFKDIQEMNETILKNFNDILNTDDTLYILGDLCMSTRENFIILKDWLNKLNTRNIVVILGNHDVMKQLDELKWNGKKGE